MKVFKFGGASLLSASAVENIVPILSPYKEKKQLLIVVSAMGKTTNALEAVWQAVVQKKDYKALLNPIMRYHSQIAEGLLGRYSATTTEILHHFEQYLTAAVAWAENKNLHHSRSANQLYDQIISLGEWLSSQIVYAFLQEQELPMQWVDARQVLRTDSTWREGQVQESITQNNVNTALKPLLQEHIVVTQGFIAGTAEGLTTTLGREGSDYSAAIFANCLDAESLTIWKDVAGVLNADPKIYPDAQLFAQLSYREAATMSYYGASVIHPKTIAPLAQKNIPLWVKSFVQPLQIGTCIDNIEATKMLPAIMHKKNVAYLKLTHKKLAYYAEKQMQHLFKYLQMHEAKVMVLQKNAFGIELVIETKQDLQTTLYKQWAKDFELWYKNQVELVTILHPNEAVIHSTSAQRQCLLKQQNTDMLHLVFAL